MPLWRGILSYLSISSLSYICELSEELGGIQGIEMLNRCDVREGTLSLADPVN